MLRVFIDAAVLKPDLGGYRTYILELVRGLAARDDLSLTVATSTPEAFDEIPAIDIVELDATTRSFSRRVLWRERSLRRLVAAARADVLLSPVPEVAFRRSMIPNVVVIHDVTALVAPALWGWQRWVRYRVGLRLAASRATAVVSVSQSTLQGLYTHLGLDPNTCHVITEGTRAPDLVSLPRSVPEILGSEDHEPYVLYVGSMLGHKNVLTLVRAALSGRDLPGFPRLVLAGPLPPSDKARLEALLDPGEGRVRHLGFVSDTDLQTLFVGAEAFVFPSLTEGFGLPVLEAMRNGTPVIASDIPAVREVGGPAVMYVETPLDPQAWRIAISALSGDVKEQDRLRALGTERAARFTWVAVAEQFAGLLQSTARR